MRGLIKQSEDSNPGTFRHNGFQDHRIRPLCQLSVSAQK